MSLQTPSDLRRAVAPTRRAPRFLWNFFTVRHIQPAAAIFVQLFDLAPEVLRHRLILTYDALARDISIENVLSRVLSTVPTMWVSPKPNDTVQRS